jgi:hypothetical protein
MVRPNSVDHLSNHSAEELLKDGKLDEVATTVDRLLSGDFVG